MKKFVFQLDRAREWRERQLAAEEAQLEKMFCERNLVERSLAVLEQEALESATAIALARSVDATDLRAMDEYRRYVAAQRIAIAAKLSAIDRRISGQQQKVLEARRRCELLDKLRERKWKAWNAEVSRAIENDAGETFLAKWTGGRP